MLPKMPRLAPGWTRCVNVPKQTRRCDGADRLQLYAYNAASSSNRELNNEDSASAVWTVVIYHDTLAAVWPSRSKIGVQAKREVVA